MQHKGLEHAVYVFAQLFGHMVGCKVVGIDLIGNQLVLHFGPVEQPCGICPYQSFFSAKISIPRLKCKSYSGFDSRSIAQTAIIISILLVFR